MGGQQRTDWTLGGTRSRPPPLTGGGTIAAAVADTSLGSFLPFRRGASLTGDPPAASAQLTATVELRSQAKRKNKRPQIHHVELGSIKDQMDKYSTATDKKEIHLVNRSSTSKSFMVDIRSGC